MLKNGEWEFKSLQYFRFKTDLKYTDCLHDEKRVSSVLYENNIQILRIRPVDILPRINPWDSLDYNNITTPYRSGYSMIFQDLATIGVPHLGWYFLAAGQMPVPVYLS